MPTTRSQSSGGQTGGDQVEEQQEPAKPNVDRKRKPDFGNAISPSDQNHPTLHFFSDPKVAAGDDTSIQLEAGQHRRFKKQKGAPVTYASLLAGKKRGEVIVELPPTPDSQEPLPQNLECPPHLKPSKNLSTSKLGSAQHLVNNCMAGEAGLGTEECEYVGFRAAKTLYSLQRETNKEGIDDDDDDIDASYFMIPRNLEDPNVLQPNHVKRPHRLDRGRRQDETSHITISGNSIGATAELNEQRRVTRSQSKKHIERLPGLFDSNHKSTPYSRFGKVLSTRGRRDSTGSGSKSIESDYTFVDHVPSQDVNKWRQKPAMVEDYHNGKRRTLTAQIVFFDNVADSNFIPRNTVKEYKFKERPLRKPDVVTFTLLQGECKPEYYVSLGVSIRGVHKDGEFKKESFRVVDNNDDKLILGWRYILENNVQLQPQGNHAYPSYIRKPTPAEEAALKAQQAADRVIAQQLAQAQAQLAKTQAHQQSNR